MITSCTACGDDYDDDISVLEQMCDDCEELQYHTLDEDDHDDRED